MTSLRIATWNLNNPRPNSGRADACRAKIAEVQADVWVITETLTTFELGNDYQCLTESQPAQDLSEDKRWVRIWVKKSLAGNHKQINTSDPERTTCAKVILPTGLGLIIYGTVLPWHNDAWPGFPKGKLAFIEALRCQQKNWVALQREYEKDVLCIAGDFNQALIIIKDAYGSKDKREALQKALLDTGLTCYTGDRSDPVNQLNQKLANIDHICLGGLPPHVSRKVTSQAWPGELGSVKMSDHYGTAVDIPFE